MNGQYQKSWISKNKNWTALVKFTKTYWYTEDRPGKIRRIFFELTKTTKNSLSFVFLNFAVIATWR
jgi:hypothetical protein